MNRALTIAFYCAVGAAIGLDTAALINTILSASGIGDGIRKIGDLYDPFDPRTYITQLVVFAPALAIGALRERRRKQN